ncbi:MAG: type II toxin-antitoxin system prevent-host-death family antitoxin [Acidimicrobiia bacterium]|nr:type II toxin-antitoxin system prevent-host-death family antitoxin [Acidimicrobiia bacterium]
MKAVGVRELKNRLSEYLRMVKAGEDILVTERGEVIAELHQPTLRRANQMESSLEDLVRQGKARMGLPNDPSVYPPLKQVLSSGAAARLLDGERTEG